MVAADTERATESVDSLLRAIAAAPEIPIGTVAPGTIVQGRFRTEQPIGKGGMGVVWRALDLQLGRSVALKLEHRIASDLARLRREARALASLSHPNVVTVLGIGLHEGATFIAMELVEGGNARQWLAARPRTWQQIVALYRQAGAGLAAAHGVGIVHRDFKPDNVLVGVEPDGSARARVADFGIARSYVADEQLPTAISGDATADRSDVSDARAGTPAYMAPEQLAGEHVDARADQYAFCVALFEALHGERPRVAGTVRRGGVPAWLDRVIERGLQREPARRWRSMDELLARLQRPRRSPLAWLAVPALAVVGLALPSRDATSCADAERSPWSPERAHAIDAALRSVDVPDIERTATHVGERLAQQSEAWTHAWREACTHGDAQLDARVACLRARRDELAAVLDVLAQADRTTVRRIGAIEQELGDPARCLDEPRSRADAPERVAAQAELARARVAFVAGRYDEAARSLVAVLDEAQRLGDRGLLAQAFFQRAQLTYDRDDHEAALADYEEAYTLALAERLDDLATRAAARAAGAHDALGRPRDALTWCGNARALANMPDVALITRTLALGVEAHVLAYAGDIDRAEALAREAVAIYGEGTSPIHRAELRGQLAQVLYRRGKFDEAIANQRETLAAYERVYGPEHPRVATASEGLGLYALHGDQRELSRTQLTRSVAIRERWFGPDDSSLVDVLGELAHLDSIEGKHDDALARLERARRIAIAFGRPEVPTLVDLDDVIGLALLGLHRYDEAVEVFRREADALERVRGPNESDLRFVLNNAAVAGQHLQRFDEAEAWLRRAIAIDDALPERDYHSGALHNSLAFLLIDRERYDEATTELEIAQRLLAANTAPDDADRAWPPFGLGRIELLRGHPERAVPLFEDALARWDVGTRIDSHRELLRELAMALWDEGRDRGRAVELARAGLADTPEDPQLAEIVAGRRRANAR
ncbi:MAG TPA: serine/threonine-protein kinase [Nannocystaceae bacterium]|nr:serine/threonine-protein kinase [Nannocystaceae bacterium]